ncbi:MAG: M50 family metallopeptidase [Candidatus Promineifilaceae bacterium]
MTFFGILRDSPMAMMFVLVSLLNAFYGWRVFRNLGSGWTSLNQEPLKPEQKRLIDQAAFFLGVPIGVLVHEMGHALMVLLFGGKIVDVGYGFYWGYVSHTGTYTASENWIIALAGTIGTLLYGVVMWLIFRRMRLTTYRYFALRVLRVHLYYALVFYPIFTLITRIGDWEIIYDFNLTPVLSGVTLAIHLSILALFYYGDRLGMFELPGFQSQAEQAQFELLKTRVAQTPQDPVLQLTLVDAYRRGGAQHLADRQLKSYLKANPTSADGYLQMALLQVQNKNHIPSKAKDNALKALSFGLSEPLAVIQANRIAGEYFLNVGKYKAAIEHFSQGITASKSAGRSDQTAHLHYQRAVAYRRQSQYDLAFQDIEKAIQLARGIEQGRALSLYESELATIQSHSGKASTMQV